MSVAPVPPRRSAVMRVRCKPSLHPAVTLCLGTSPPAPLRPHLAGCVPTEATMVSDVSGDPLLCVLCPGAGKLLGLSITRPGGGSGGDAGAGGPEPGVRVALAGTLDAVAMAGVSATGVASGAAAPGLAAEGAGASGLQPDLLTLQPSGQLVLHRGGRGAGAAVPGLAAARPATRRGTRAHVKDACVHACVRGARRPRASPAAGQPTEVYLTAMGAPEWRRVEDGTSTWQPVPRLARP